MNITVDLDTKRNTLFATDQDKCRKKYRETGNNLTITFSSPLLSSLDKNKFYLLRNSERKILDIKYYYRPDTLSYDEYGTETLWYLLMYVNDVNCIEEFDKYNVYIPTYGSILQVIKKDLSKNIIDINAEEHISKSLLDLYQSKIKPNFSEPEESIDPEEEEPMPALFWIRQKFNINTNQEINCYVDLAYEVLPETITLKINNAGNFIHNVDYNVIKSFDNKYRRFTWQDEFCTEGNGMEGSIKSGMILEIQYAKK